MYLRNFRLLLAALLCIAPAALTFAADPADQVLRNVKNLYLETNGCTPQFSEALQDADYILVSDRQLADAILKVDVHQLDASMGASARYSATLQQHNGYELFGTSGSEDSIDQEELCEDISEDVVDAMVARSEFIP